MAQPAAAAAAAPQPAAAPAPAQAAAPAAAAQAQARPPVAGLPRPIVVPNDFAGTSADDWPTFLAKFNAACVVNGYANPDRLQFLPCCLRDNAFTVFNAIVTANPQATYVQVCQELDQRFNPPQQSRLLEAEFRARVKLTTETQLEFASALTRLANRAFPGQQGQLLDRLMLNQFIDGQPSTDLRLHIRTAGPATLDAAVQRALEIGSIFEVEQRRASAASDAARAHASVPGLTAAAVHVNESPVASSTDPLVLSLLSKISEQLSALSTSDARSTPPNRRGRDPPVAPRATGPAENDGCCFNCGDPDHFASDCPRRRPPAFRGGFSRGGQRGRPRGRGGRGFGRPGNRY